MKLTFISGPMSSTNPIEFLNNVRLGIEIGKEKLTNGEAVIIPHLDYSILIAGGSSITREQLRQNSLEHLRRCDAIIFLPKWEDSDGCRVEMIEAKKLNLEISFKEDLSPIAVESTNDIVEEIKQIILADGVDPAMKLRIIRLIFDEMDME